MVSQVILHKCSASSFYALLSGWIKSLFPFCFLLFLPRAPILDSSFRCFVPQRLMLLYPFSLSDTVGCPEFIQLCLWYCIKRPLSPCFADSSLTKISTDLVLFLFLPFFFFNLHLHLAILILPLTFFSSDFFSGCLVCLFFYIPGWWCGFFSMVSPPFLVNLSHSPSLSSVVAQLGTYPGRVFLATCTKPKPIPPYGVWGSPHQDSMHLSPLSWSIGPSCLALWWLFRIASLALTHL